MNLAKIHKYSRWLFIASLVVGFFLPTMHEGDPNPTYLFWAFGFSQYLFVYIFHANSKGEIYVPYSPVLKKSEELGLFRVFQGMYGVFSIVVLIVIAYELT